MLRRRCRELGRLAPPQVGVELAAGEQAGVGPTLDDPALVEDQDLVGIRLSAF
jgi:hypothetical protein